MSQNQVPWPLYQSCLFKMIFSFFQDLRKQTQNNAFTFAPPYILRHIPKKIIKCHWSTWFSSSLTRFAMSVLVSQGLPMTTSAGETGELSCEMASPIGIDLIRRMHIGTFAKRKTTCKHELVLKSHVVQYPICKWSIDVHHFDFSTLAPYHAIHFMGV